MVLGLHKLLDDFIRVSLEPIMEFLSAKGGDAEFILETILRAMADRTSIHDALVRLNVEGAKGELEWFSLGEVNRTRQYEITRLFKRITVDEAVSAISEALNNQVVFGRKTNLIPGKGIVIIDQHEREAWNAVNKEYIVPINPKKKRHSKGFKFYSALVKVGNIGFFVAFTHDGDGVGGARDKGEIVGVLLSQVTEHIKISLLLMDTGFYSGNIWSLLPNFIQDAMCPVPRNTRVTRLITDHHRRLEYHYLPGAKPFDFAGMKLTLIFSPRPSEKRDIKFRQG